MGLAWAAQSASPAKPPAGQLTPWDIQSGDHFGTDLAVNERWLLVGSPGDDLIGRDSGSVAVFERVPSGWRQRDILAPENGRPGEYFGSCLALSNNFCAIGAPWDGTQGPRSGAVYVFAWDGKFWKQVNKVYAPDPAADARFGHAIDLEGQTLVVGARFANAGEMHSGSAYVFHLDSGGRADAVQTISPPQAHSGAEFGFSVALDGDGLVVGSWAEPHAGLPSGAAHIFRETAGLWQHEAKLSAPGNPTGGCFGLDVDIEGERCAVGAPWENTGSEHAGAAYLWRKGEQGWELEQRIHPSSQQDQTFGIAVQLTESQQLLVGARRGAHDVLGAGSVFQFARGEEEWGLVSAWNALTPHAGDDFGLSLAHSASEFLVGARHGDQAGRRSEMGFVHLRGLLRPGVASELISVARPKFSAGE